MSDDVEYAESNELRICDCGTVLRNGSWCATCRQHIWEIRPQFRLIKSPPDRHPDRSPSEVRP